MRGRTAWTVLAVAVALVALAGCSGSEENKGSLPVPAGSPGDDKTITLGTPTAEPTKSSEPTTTSAPKTSAKLTVVVGSFGSIPAVQGLATKYPQYYQALVQRNPDVVRKTFPAFFYADVAINIDAAKQKGWVMRPPGSIVVVGTSNQSEGIVRVNYCRSQKTQWWNPKTRKYAVVAPHGTAESIDMARTGLGWTMYKVVRPVPKGIDCSKVRYPA